VLLRQPCERRSGGWRMRTFIAKVIHLRISPAIKGDDFYICSKKRKLIVDGRWTWNNDKVTCKNCLKILNNHPCFMQRRTAKFIDESNDVLCDNGVAE